MSLYFVVLFSKAMFRVKRLSIVEGPVVEGPWNPACSSGSTFYLASMSSTEFLRILEYIFPILGIMAMPDIFLDHL